MGRYTRGSVVRLQDEVRNSAGALYDPDGGVTIEVFDKDGNVLLASVSMTKESVGKYYYDWTISAGLTYTGWVRQRCNSLDGSKPSIKDDFEAFEIY